MDVGGPWILVAGLFYYTLLFWPAAVANYTFSFLLGRRFAAHPSFRSWRYAPVIFPVAGILFYLTIDSFEARQQVGLWWSILIAISLLPAALFIVLFGLTRRKTKATRK
jgi:hypothetical protein